MKLDASAWSTTVDSTVPPTVKPPRMSGIVACGSVNQHVDAVVGRERGDRDAEQTEHDAERDERGNARRYGPSGACASTMSQQIPITTAT